ncbi:MAG: hypothetical protein FJ126_05970 [Deltaproteobacteria bacterium]|nr:hypothetical protein [Deltaproteobacteria bacterium]
MTIQLTIDLPEDVFSLLRKSPSEFVGELRLAAAVKWYELGTISQSKAAELAGVSRQEFLEALNRFKVSPFQVTPEELAREAAMPKKWVVNASPLIVLARINHLLLLQHLAEEIVVPAGVAKEIAQGPGNDPARDWLQTTGQALMREVEVVPPVIITWNLGLGESEVLAWAYQNHGFEAVLDDRAARNCALSLNIPVRGTISLILLAKKAGYLKEVTPVLLNLEQI